MSLPMLIALAQVRHVLHAVVHARIDELKSAAAQDRREKKEIEAQAEESRWFPQLDGEMEEEMGSDWSENEF
jgi:hypothetical protein